MQRASMICCIPICYHQQSFFTKAIWYWQVRDDCRCCEG